MKSYYKDRNDYLAKSRDPRAQKEHVDGSISKFAIALAVVIVLAVAIYLGLQ